MGLKSFFDLTFLGRRGVREAGLAKHGGFVTIRSLSNNLQSVRMRAAVVYLFLCCFFIGSMFYSFKLNLGFVDTVYFLSTTISTVG